MADLSRQSAFMPTIKCSSCGNQVEISMMGEHVCQPTGAPEEPLPPPPPAPDLLGGAFSSLRANVFDKLTRAAPPSVDTSAANRANVKLDQITPISASTGSQAISPKTPNGRAGPGPNGEEYFGGPAIADSPPPAQNRRPGGYGGLGDPEAPDSDSQFGTSPPKQPPSLLTRMNSIAPGPFEMNQRPSTGLRANSSNGLRSSRPGSRDDDGPRPSTASSVNGAGVPLPRMPRKNGYGGFGPPSRNGEDFDPPSLGMGKRADTFPKPRPAPMEDVPARTPSAPGPRQDRMRSSSANVENGPLRANDQLPRPSLSIRDTSRPPPPRKSLIRPTTREGSSAPSINLADEFGESNPYHSPSISQSSSLSGYSQRSSQRSQASSSTSPARSVGPRRVPSDGPKMDDLMDDLQSSIEALHPSRPAPRPQGPPIESAGPRQPAGTRRGPPEALRLDPAVQAGQGGGPGSAGSPPLRSPMFPNRRDPAIQAGQGSPPLRSPLFQNNNNNNNNNNNARRDPAIQEPREPRSRSPRPRSPPPPPPPPPELQQQQRRPSHAGHARQPSRSRGNCKACGQAIMGGKSISSADGRLTGRYHKACFVCATCREPFAGTTFYVLGDRPYCERHYHALNGSLCGTCDRGIEGQYLEDETAGKKHHVGCFRCRDCGVVLRDGYFEVAGEALCERDALRRVQQPAVANNNRFPPPMQGQGMMRPPSRGLPPGPGLPSGPAPGALNRPFGLPSGQRLAPGQALGRGGLGPIPRMQKRMTRLGMMGPA